MSMKIPAYVCVCRAKRPTSIAIDAKEDCNDLREICYICISNQSYILWNIVSNKTANRAAPSL